MTKIFYVERNPIQRELTANHLERRAHEVTKFIPEYYFHSRPKDDGSLSLNSRDDFVAQIRADNPEVLLVDRESFPEENPARDYIAAVLNSGYAGKIVLTYTALHDFVAAELGENDQRVKHLIKPFGLPDLDQILASD